MNKKTYAVFIILISLQSFLLLSFSSNSLYTSNLKSVFISSSTSQRIFEPFKNNPSIYSDLGMNKLINEGYKGRNITIAILDTGINDTDSRLNRNNTKIVKRNINFVQEEPEYDLNGHGTSIAGLIAMKLSYIPSLNIQVSGIATEANLWNIKVLNKDGEGNILDIMNGIQYCIDQYTEIDIINLSFGIIKTNENKNILSELENKIKELWNLGVIVVAAAGNNGNMNQESGSSYSSLFTINTPSSVLEVISVGACLNDSMLSFSSIGPSPHSHYIKPDIVAPGADIITIYLDNHFISNAQGTSYSAPIISAGIALLLEKVGKKHPNLIKAALYDSAISLGYHFYEEGVGMPNFSRAAELLMDNAYLGISFLPKNLSFPNFFDPEKEFLISDVNSFFPEQKFKNLYCTLIIGKNYSSPIIFQMDDELSSFINIKNDSILTFGQHAIGIDFIESFFVNNKFVMLKYGTYQGYINFYITEGTNQYKVASVFISISISILGILKTYFFVILFIIISFVSLIVVKKRNNLSDDIISTIPLDKCPKGYECECSMDGTLCSIKKKNNA